MSVEPASTIARTGRLAAQFARRTAEHISFRRPGSAVWEARLAARRGAAQAMPRLTVSLHRLLEETPRIGNRRAGAMRDQGRQFPAHPVARSDLSPSRSAVSRPADDQLLTVQPPGGIGIPHRMPSKAPLLPGSPPPPPGDRSAAPAVVPPRRPPFRLLALGSRGLPAASAGETAENLPSVSQEPALRHLPPSTLRKRLVGQSGLGEILTNSLREKLRPHLTFDPAMARLHRGAAAAAAARELKAEAFTIGPDVFFAEGRYAPETRDGLSLLTHELTHVGQQAAVIGDKMRFFTAQGGDALESEAQQTAAQAVGADDRERKNRTGGVLHQASAPPQLALAFALSSARAHEGTSSIPAQKATEESGQPGTQVSPVKTDARAITDRVYELLKQDIILGRERGSLGRKGI